MSISYVFPDFYLGSSESSRFAAHDLTLYIHESTQKMIPQTARGRRKAALQIELAGSFLQDTTKAKKGEKLNTKRTIVTPYTTVDFYIRFLLPFLRAFFFWST